MLRIYFPAAYKIIGTLSITDLYIYAVKEFTLKFCEHNMARFYAMFADKIAVKSR